MVRLRDLGRWSGGNTPSKANPAYWTDGTIPWVSPKDMKVDEILTSEDRITSKALEEGRVSMVPAGSILLVTRSGILAHTLPVAVTRTPVTVNQDLKALSPKPGVLPKYVAHALRGASRHILKSCAKHGTTVASIDTNALLDFEIPLVDLEAQHATVAEIEKQFSRLDEAVANLQRVRSSLRRYCTSLLAEAAASDEEPVTVGSLLREPIVNGLSVKESATPTPVRALRLSAMTNAGLNFADHRFLPVEPQKVEDIVVKEGDFFVSRGNGSLALVGRGVIAQTPPFPVIFPDTMMRLRFADAEITRWVAILWPSRHVRSQIEQRVKTTAGIYKVAQPQVASIKLPMPPLAKRQEIVAEVDRRLSIVRGVEAEVDANLKRAQVLRQAVLARAFSGEPLSAATAPQPPATALANTA
jgi:type I restriction enzyme S subunit